MKETARKAEKLLALHHEPRLLLLPNIWDPFGAMTLESLGYPAVATASASVAYSQGVRDGEQLPFEKMLDRVGEIAEAVQIPVTADLEAGFATVPEEVAANVKRALERGVVGINFEDSDHSRGGLYTIEAQCDRIRAIRAMADGVGVPLVINARTDVFLRADDSSGEEKLEHCVQRLSAYRAAGADCLYPIPLGDVKTLGRIHKAVDAPLNAFAGADADSLQVLEEAGVQRVSFGPGLFRAVQGRLRSIAEGLRDAGSYAALRDGALSNREVHHIVARGGNK